MNTKSFRERVRAAGAWLKNLSRARNGSRAHLVLVGFGAVVLLVVITAIASKEIAHHKAVEAMAVATAPANVQSVQRAPSVVPAHGAVVPPASAGAGRVAVSATAPATSPAPEPVAAVPAVVFVPPAGLVAGQVKQTIFQQDTYGQFAQLTARVVPSLTTSWNSYVASPNSPPWQETFSGWFHLTSPSTIAVLRVGGGGAAKSENAEIDGVSLGDRLGYGPASETSPLPLAPGWHSFTVTAEGRHLYYMPSATPIQLELGNGADAPMLVMPYAIAPQPAASARAATAAQISSAVPTPAQTSAKVTPASAPPAPMAPAKASTVGAAKEH